MSSGRRDESCRTGAGSSVDASAADGARRRTSGAGREDSAGSDSWCSQR